MYLLRLGHIPPVQVLLQGFLDELLLVVAVAPALPGIGPLALALVHHNFAEPVEVVDFFDIVGRIPLGHGFF